MTMPQPQAESSSLLNFSIPQKTLEKALSFTNAIIEKKNLVPVLSHTKIKADGKLTFTATNMDLVIKETCDANIQTQGEVCVPSEIFYDIVKKIDKSETISCFMQENRLFIKTARSEFRIPTLEAHLFPDISELPFDVVLTFKAQELLALLKNVAFCTRVNDNRYALSGVYTHQNEQGGLTCVATDLHRLATSSLDLPLHATFVPFIIGQTTVHEWQRILTDCEGDVKVHISPSRIQLEAANSGLFIIMGSRLVDGIYPDYKKVIVKNHPNHAVISAETLQAALERIALVLSEDNNHVRFQFKKNHLSLHARSQNLGAGDEELDMQYEGPELSIVLNGHYMLDIARHIDHENLNVYMNGSYDSFIIETPKAQYFVMPLIA